MSLPKALLKCCPAYCLLLPFFKTDEEVEEEEEVEPVPTPPPEEPVKPPKPRGISLHLGTDNGLGQIAFTLRYDVRREILKLHICYARELVAMDPRGTSDPYVKVSFIPIRYSGVIYKTSVIKRTLRPKWYETFVFKNFPNEDLKTHILVFTVMDWDKSGDDDVMGELEFPLKKMYKRIPGQKRPAPSTIGEESASINSNPSFHDDLANDIDRESGVSSMHNSQAMSQERIYPDSRISGTPSDRRLDSRITETRLVPSTSSNASEGTISNSKLFTRSQEELSIASQDRNSESGTQINNDEISRILADPNFRSVSQASFHTESRLQLQSQQDGLSLISSSQMPPQNEISKRIDIPDCRGMENDQRSTSRPRTAMSRVSHLLGRRSRSASSIARRSMTDGRHRNSDMGSVVSHGSKLSINSQGTIFEETPGQITDATTSRASRTNESSNCSGRTDSEGHDCDSNITRNINFREGSLYSSEPFESDDEEDDVEVERPFVIRRLEVKKYLWAPTNSRYAFGELQLGIGYYPKHMVLIVRVIKARHMRDPDTYTLNPYVTITLRRLTDKKEKTLQTVQTSVRSHVDHPVWNEQFQFKVAPRYLKHTAIDIKILSVASHSTLLGQLRLAVKSYPSQREHFQSMLSNLGHISERWHLVRQ